MMARALCMSSARLAAAWVAAQRKAGDRVVLAHGSFAPLTLDDVKYLTEAGRLGQRLLVLVEGPTLPAAREQSELVAALRGVDAVVPRADLATLVTVVLSELRPDVYAARAHRSEDVAWCAQRGIELVPCTGLQRGAA